MHLVIFHLNSDLVQASGPQYQVGLVFLHSTRLEIKLRPNWLDFVRLETELVTRPPSSEVLVIICFGIDRDFFGHKCELECTYLYTWYTWDHSNAYSYLIKHLQVFCDIKVHFHTVASLSIHFNAFCFQLNTLELPIEITQFPISVNST